MPIRRSTLEIVKNSRIRVWTMDGGASAFVVPKYQGFMKAGTPRATAGAGTPVTNQSFDILDDFDIVDEIEPARTNPTLGLTGRYQYEKSFLLDMYNRRCFLDAQAHIGKCQDPTDFNRGWDKILAIEKAKVSDWGTSADLGALNEGDRAVVDETATLTGARLYEINKINVGPIGASTILTRVMDLVIADSIRCTGSCGGTPSDGCQRLFAIQTSGILAASEDGGATWVTSNTGSVTPLGLIASGQNILVYSAADESYFYKSIEDILAGTGTWTEVTTGFIATKGPNAGISLGASYNWFVGNLGAIYFSEDPESEVVPQSDAGVTAENILAIDAWDTLHLVAVGANNVVLYTENGGESWNLVTGPSVGNDLISIAMKSESEWQISDDAGGLFSTRNYGRTWKTVAHPAGVINQIKYSSNQVGWAATTNTTVGRLLRTVDGGRSWYVAPERVGAVTTFGQTLDRLAVCNNVDHAYAAGLGAVADGQIVEAA